jgi:cytochrome oxidase Cu insertion factor (SCO1/SenC/PrrC family)
MRIVSTVLTAAVVTCSSLLIAGQQGDPHAGHDHSKHAHDKAEIAHEAPAFTLKGVDGKTYSLADYKGKVVVLEWFCSSCPASGRGEGSFCGNHRGSS